MSKNTKIIGDEGFLTLKYILELEKLLSNTNIKIIKLKLENIM